MNMTQTDTTQDANTRNGKIPIDRLIEAAESDEMIGFCTNCGEEASGVEPDAERYRCERCNAPAVFGTEQLMLQVMFL